MKSPRGSRFSSGIVLPDRDWNTDNFRAPIGSYARQSVDGAGRRLEHSHVLANVATESGAWNSSLARAWSDDLMGECDAAGSDGAVGAVL